MLQVSALRGLIRQCATHCYLQGKSEVSRVLYGCGVGVGGCRDGAMGSTAGVLRIAWQQ